MSFEDTRKLKLIILLFVSFILINPFVIFLLSKDLILSTILWLCLSLFILSLYQVTSKYRWILVYAINFISIVSIFLYSEAVLRFVYFDYIIEDLYTIEPGYFFNKPKLYNYLEDKEYKALYRTNDEGYRIPETVNTNKLIESCDWLFLGDSYTQGAQVEFEELFTSHLYKNFPDKIIVNAGISGFGLPEYYNYYKDKGVKLKPKKVFLQICNFNDFMNVEEKQVFMIDYLMHYSDFIRLLLYNIKYKQPSELPLGRWTEPFYKDRKDNIKYNIFFKEKSERKVQDLENFRAYLIKLNKEVKKNNSELIVFQIPTKEQIYYKYFEEVINNFNIDVRDLDMDYPNKFLKGLSDSLGIRYLDLTDGLVKYPNQVFFDYDEHLNKEGHAALAERLTDYIKKFEPLPDFRLLSASYWGDRYPSYSRDSESIYFQSFRHNNMEIFKCNSEFDSIVRITNNNVDESHPSISPDGKLLVFTEGNAERHNTKVTILNLNTGVREYITKGNNEFGAIPTFSNDGNKIVFARWFYDKDEKNYTNPEVVISDLEGNIIKVVVDDKYENWRPVFSPNDSLVVFISKRSSFFDIYLKNIFHGTEEQITSTPYDEWDPQFSPDGKKIVYAAKENRNWNLIEFDLINKTYQKLTNSLGNNWDPQYSPDGRYIVFAGEYGFMNGIYRLSRF